MRNFILGFMLMVFAQVSFAETAQYPIIGNYVSTKRVDGANAFFTLPEANKWMVTVSAVAQFEPTMSPTNVTCRMIGLDNNGTNTPLYKYMVSSVGGSVPITFTGYAKNLNLTLSCYTTNTLTPTKYYFVDMIAISVDKIAYP
jgi:hypothetical protein